MPVNNVLDDVIPQLLAQGLMVLRQNAIMPRLVNLQYDTLAGEKGSTIDVPVSGPVAVQNVVPGPYSNNTGDVEVSKVPITLDQWKEAPFALSDKELMEIKDGTIPMQAAEAVKALANTVDAFIFTKALGIYGWVGKANGDTATDPFASDTSDATAARKVLNRQLAPLNDRRVVLNPEAEANALNLRAFHDMSFSGDASAIREGNLNRKFGFDWWMDQNVPVHTLGASQDWQTAGVVAAGASTAVLDNGTPSTPGASAPIVGDVFTVAGDTQTYVITAFDAGTRQITFAPKAGAGGWADDADLTFKASHSLNLAFHRECLAFVNRPLVSSLGDELGGARMQSAVDPVSGLTLRLEVRREHKRMRWSFDMLYGSTLLRPELGTRIAGAA